MCRSSTSLLCAFTSYTLSSWGTYFKKPTFISACIAWPQNLTVTSFNHWTFKLFHHKVDDWVRLSMIKTTKTLISMMNITWYKDRGKLQFALNSKFVHKPTPVYGIIFSKYSVPRSICMASVNDTTTVSFDTKHALCCQFTFTICQRVLVIFKLVFA